MLFMMRNSYYNNICFRGTKSKSKIVPWKVCRMFPVLHITGTVTWSRGPISNLWHIALYLWQTICQVTTSQCDRGAPGCPTKQNEWRATFEKVEPAKTSTHLLSKKITLLRPCRCFFWPLIKLVLAEDSSPDCVWSLRVFLSKSWPREIEWVQ